MAFQCVIASLLVPGIIIPTRGYVSRSRVLDDAALRVICHIDRLAIIGRRRTTTPATHGRMEPRFPN